MTEFPELDVERRLDRPPGECETLEDLATLDEAEILSGYMCRDLTPPAGASRSFLHGWLNRRVDMGRGRPSAAQMKLANAVVARGRKNA